MRSSFFLILIMGVLFLIPAIAFAYLDPGSMNFVVQAIFGVIIGALYALKLYWNKVKETTANFFKSKSKH